jgi:hypothetical protein
MSTDVLRVFYFSPRWLPENQFSVMFSQVMWWGGWGSNPRPADYENYGPCIVRTTCTDTTEPSRRWR